MELLTFSKKLKEFEICYFNQIENLPYHFNIIDELHANENAHTRILQKLLLYKQKNNYPFLTSFLDKMIPQRVELSSPKIEFNQEFIDLLIEDDESDFACIIENKVHYALDQYKQIERYINSVKAHGKNNIFVIYLTSDGNKEVSDVSLTSKAKAFLGYIDNKNTGNFLPINFKENILPWLKNDVLPKCINEKQILSGITQYIDHLEGMFNQREDKSKMNEELIKKIKADFNITGVATSDYEKLIQCQKILATYQMELDNLKKQMQKDNPWTQPPEEKAIWLAEEIRNRLNEDSSKLAPFSKVWIYNYNVVVLEGWNLKNYKFAIDINCSNLSNNGISIADRNKLKKEEYEVVFQKDFASVFAKHEIKYLNNYRYAKSFNEITNSLELNQFIDYIYLLLKDLTNLTSQLEC